MVLCCGLVTLQKDPVPLKSISVEVRVRGFVADVSSTLQYKNKESSPVEAVFVFPMEGSSAVYRFTARIGGVEIEAEVRDKQEAREQYDDALSSGLQAFLLEESDESPDVFRLSVGSLAPGESASVSLFYVTELPVQEDAALRFCLPAVLNPRYTSVGSASITADLPCASGGSVPYSLSLSAHITSPSAIDRVQCSCPISPLEYLTQDKTQAKLSLSPGHKFDRDVELLVYYCHAHQPTAILEAGLPFAPPGTLMADPMLMLSLFPEFPIAETTLSSNGEFIFLMDCSGSMQNPMDRESGAQQRIESARDTLVLLLKSLPLGCHFNIYSFGSQYESFFPESVEYTQDSMESALKKVMVMQADMGGTEILFPLREIYKQPCQAAHPRQLFVFTDGEVSNTKEVIDLVRSHAFSHRCFTFGIGEGASSSLITGMARAGSGHPQFITGTDRLQSKVMQSLRFALQPVVKEISVCWDVPPGIKVSLLSPSPTMLFRGQRALLYAQLTGQCDSSAVGSVCLQYTLGDKSVKNGLTFSLNSDMDSGLAIHRLGACTLIRFLEGQERERAQGKEKEVLNQRLIKLSTESGVSCSHTAFIAINKDNKQPVQGALLCRDIPGKRVECQFDLRCLSSLLSRDYNLFPEEPTTYSIEPLVFRDKPARLDTPNYRAARFYDPYASSEPVSKPEEDPMLMMITLQKANGSWELNKSVASVLGKTKKEVTSKMPKEALNTNIWATVLALLWLYGFKLDFKDEWHFVAMKAVSWIKSQSVALQTIEGTEGTATPYRWALLLLLVLCCVSLAAVIALSIFYFQNSRYSGEIKSDFRSAFQKADAQPTINLMKTKEVLQMAIKREEQRCKDILNRAQRKCKSSFVIQESNNSAIAGPEFITNLSIASMELKRSLIKAEEECIGAMNRSTQECLKSISQLHLELDSFHHVSDEEYMMSLTGSERSCQNILRTANQKCKLSLSKMHQDCLRNLSRADGMFESVLATEKKECIRNLTIADVRCRSSLNEVHWQCKTNVSIVNQQHKFNLSNQETWFKRIIDKKEEAYSASLLQAKQECQVNLNKSHLECQTSISEEQLQCKSHLSKMEQVYSMSVQEAKQDCERNFSQAQQKSKATLSKMVLDCRNKLSKANQNWERALTAARQDCKSNLTAADEVHLTTLQEVKQECSQHLSKAHLKCKTVVDEIKQECKSNLSKTEHDYTKLLQDTKQECESSHTLARMECKATLGTADLDFRTNISRINQDWERALGAAHGECVRNLSAAEQTYGASLQQVTQEYMLNLSRVDLACKASLRLMSQVCEANLTDSNRNCESLLRLSHTEFKASLKEMDEQCQRNLTQASQHYYTTLVEAQLECKRNLSIADEQCKTKLSTTDQTCRKYLNEKEQMYSISLLQTSQECKENLTKADLECQALLKDEQLECKSNFSRTELLYKNLVEESKQDCEKTLSQFHQGVKGTLSTLDMDCRTNISRMNHEWERTLNATQWECKVNLTRLDHEWQTVLDEAGQQCASAQGAADLSCKRALHEAQQTFHSDLSRVEENLKSQIVQSEQECQINLTKAKRECASTLRAAEQQYLQNLTRTQEESRKCQTFLSETVHECATNLMTSKQVCKRTLSRMKEEIQKNLMEAKLECTRNLTSSNQELQSILTKANQECQKNLSQIERDFRLRVCGHVRGSCDVNPGLNFCPPQSSLLCSSMCCEDEPCGICPVGWMRGQHGKCYFISMKYGTWVEASQQCYQFGSRLLVLNNYQELIFFRHYTEMDVGHWIGLQKDQGTWKWPDNKPLNSNMFVVNQYEKGNCAAQHWDNTQNIISSASCSNTYRWICEKESL